MKEIGIVKHMKKYEVFSGDFLCGVVEEDRFCPSGEGIVPLALLNGENFTKWVSDRALSSDRGLTARSLKSASGLSPHTSEFDTAMRIHAASITDNYWMRKSDESITYREVCLDSYDGFFAHLALGLDYSVSDYLSKKNNPELTNIGNSDKAWQIDRDGQRWLYKRQPLRECFQEILASKIAFCLGVSTVEYELVVASEPNPELGRTGIVRSRDFTQNRGLNLEHVSGLVKDEHSVREAAELFDRYGLVKEYLDLRYLDILTGNPDRHVFNYGFLRDQKTGRISDIAPNFDNNFAFMAMLPVEEFVSVAKNYVWAPTEMNLSLLIFDRKEIAAFENYPIDAYLKTVREKEKQIKELLMG